MPDERAVVETDIVCVGFGPATAGFLTTIAPHLVDAPGAPTIQSAAMPGMPLQVIAFERADGPGFGVSGVVTRARAVRSSIPDFDPAHVPLATPVTRERIVYLLDPIGASRRSAGIRAIDRVVTTCRGLLPYGHHAVELPFVPPFLRKDGGVLLSIGQFMQWVSGRLMESGAVQLWPSTPVAAPLFEGRRVAGVRLVDQGVDRVGNPAAGFTPGMDVRARLTVVGDGPTGAVGQAIDRELGMPPGHARREWAVGVKMVVGLRSDAALEPGTVIHTFGYPEPGIFGFLYVHADRVASVGIFVPSWLDAPATTAYRYLQHWMLHPWLWQHLRGGSMRSWGAKSLQESGRRGEPHLAGDGFARIGEGSGSTNVLTGSGVDDAWSTGVQLGEAVLELLHAGEPFTRANLDRTYVARRRAGWMDAESRAAEHARGGFEYGVLRGLIGMALAGATGGRIALRGSRHPERGRWSLEERVRARIDAAELDRLVRECRGAGVPLHDALMDRCGWPPIPFDGKLLVSHQDALLLGGKVQAAPGYADHVVFLAPDLCRTCAEQACVEICSGQALLPGPDGLPTFDREKCVHCGACFWTCTQPTGADGRSNIDFRAGAGGLHSGEN